MGRMSYEEYEDFITLPATVYGIDVFNPKEGLTQQDIFSILNTLHRYRAAYLFVSFLLVTSTTDAVRREVIRTGKRGQPKKVPVGKKVPQHVHIAVIGDEQHSAYTYKEAVQEAINKRLADGKFRIKSTKDESKGHKEHAANYIGYCFRQADSVRTAGEFNFYRYRNFNSIK